MLFLLLTLLVSVGPEIIDRPIKYDETRRKLTIEYRQRHGRTDAATDRIEPRVIVLHHTGFSTLERTWQYFDRVRIDDGRGRVTRAGDVNVSAHFLVDRNGTIYRLLGETTMARHTIGLNHVAIGIENVGGKKSHPLTRAQVEANVALIRDLVRRFPKITHVIGHHEYQRMESHTYFNERDPKYRTTKVDPGPAFMRRVRGSITDLGLEAAP